MSNEAAEDLASADSGSEDEDKGVKDYISAMNLINPPVLGSQPRISPSTKTAEFSHHVSDSGYGSARTTPQFKDKGISLRKPGQIPLIERTGLCISTKSMEPETKRRFLEVQLEIERMLLELMRKQKSGPGRHKPIAIRLMMLGKTEADEDAMSYLVVICSEDMKRKVQDFFDEPLVKSLCEPGDDDVPSFRVLVIGHALRLRASTSDTSVQCGPIQSPYDCTSTFCGMPIRLCDGQGHPRKATFGGMVKVTSTDGECHMYGLTAGHIIRDDRNTKDEDDTMMDVWDGSDLVDLGLSEENHSTTGSPSVLSDDNDQDGSDNWYFRNPHHLGKVLDTNRGDAPVNGEQIRMKPCLDWALFELNAHRPNQLAHHGRERRGGDLHLPVSITDSRKYGIPVSMLCASQGVKRGVLSNTRARVLLDPGHSFTDAYTLSLDSTEVSDGDSGSWVVDDLRLEVHGHVVADDIFGDAYVIPMADILADIQHCFGAESVDLPSGLDIISMAPVQQPSLLAGPSPRDRPLSQMAEGIPGSTFSLSNTGKGASLPVHEEQPACGMSLTDFAQLSLPTSPSVDPRDLAVPVPPPEAFILHPEQIIRPLDTNHVNPCTVAKFASKFPHVTHGSGYGSPTRDSGYGSLDVTPNTSPPPPIDKDSPQDGCPPKRIDLRV